MGVQTGAAFTKGNVTTAIKIAQAYTLGDMASKFLEIYAIDILIY